MQRSNRGGTSLLDAILFQDPATIVREQLENCLLKSGSTWVTSKSYELSGVKGCVEAATQSDKFVSTTHGLSEYLLANLLYKKNQECVSKIELLCNGLTDRQAYCADRILSLPIACLSGLPGSGKTYTARSIANSAIRSGLRVLGCSLTGIAASRLRESAGISSTTIHRLLGHDGAGFTVSEVPCDFLVVDECGMVNPGLLLALLSRAKNARVLLMGDPNQLPSVLPGDLFSNLCDILPHYHLSDIIRTEADSPIGNAAKLILSGSVPQSEASSSGVGGVWISVWDGGPIKNGKRPKNHPLSIAESCAEKDKTALMDIRTMCATNDMVDFLNVEFKFRRNKLEKVPIMCIKNNHSKNVYNGDIGYKGVNCVVFGENSVLLRPSDSRTAWATTVHKAQGQECLSAQFVIQPFADRRVLYTALTRAKRRFVFTGNPVFLQKIVQSIPTKRTTLLREFFRKEAIVTTPEERWTFANE